MKILDERRRNIHFNPVSFIDRVALNRDTEFNLLTHASKNGINPLLE